MFALSQTGFGAGRLDRCIGHFGVTLCGDFLTGLDLFTAGNAVCVSSVAGIGAGSLLGIPNLGICVIADTLRPLGIKGDAACQIHNRAIGVCRTVAFSIGIPSGKVVSFLGESIGFQCRIGRSRNGLCLHGALAAVCVEGHSHFTYRHFDAPLAVFIAEGVAGLGVRSRCVAAVCIVQLGGGDGDIHICNCRAGLCGLVGGCGGSRAVGQNHLASTVTGLDIRAAGGSVETTVCR